MLDKYDWIFNHNMIKLWSHKYSSGKTKFVDCQHFDGLWGRIFVSNWFVALKCNTIHYFVKSSLGRKFVGKGNPRNPQTLIPHEQL